MHPSQQTRTYTLLFFVVAALGVGWLCFQALKPFLAAIAWAIVLAVAFRMPWAWLETKLPKRRGAAALLLTLAIALLVLLPAALFVVVLAGQAVETANRVADALQSEKVSTLRDVVALPSLAPLLDQLEARAGLTQEDVNQLVDGLAARASRFAGAVSGRLVLGFFDVVLTFLATIVLLFFFLRDGAAMNTALMDLLPVDDEERDRLGDSLSAMLRAIFRGSLVCALSQGVTGAIGWMIAGLPSPALAGAAMAICSLLPIGGTAIVWLPGALWAWTQGHHGAAIFLFLWGAVVTSFLADNVLRPLLLRRSPEMSMMVAFLGVFGGIAAFGLVGIFIGPMALAAAATLLGVLRRWAGAARRQASSPPVPLAGTGSSP